VKDITNILKAVKWIAQARYSFSKIKKVISEGSVLTSPNYTELFSIFSFSSDTTIAVILLQRNDDQQEQPSDFFNKVMIDVELRYGIIEKQAYTLVQALKDFWIHVLYSPIIAYVPNNVVKIVLTQPDTDGKRGIWISNILEFDLDIKPTKLVKGQG